MACMRLSQQLRLQAVTHVFDSAASRIGAGNSARCISGSRVTETKRRARHYAASFGIIL